MLRKIFDFLFLIIIVGTFAWGYHNDEFHKYYCAVEKEEGGFMAVQIDKQTYENMLNITIGKPLKTTWEQNGTIQPIQ